MWSIQWLAEFQCFLLNNGFLNTLQNIDTRRSLPLIVELLIAGIPPSQYMRFQESKLNDAECCLFIGKRVFLINVRLRHLKGQVWEAIEIHEMSPFWKYYRLHSDKVTPREREHSLWRVMEEGGGRRDTHVPVVLMLPFADAFQL